MYSLREFSNKAYITTQFKPSNLDRSDPLGSIPPPNTKRYRKPSPPRYDNYLKYSEPPPNRIKRYYPNPTVTVLAQLVTNTDPNPNIQTLIATPVRPDEPSPLGTFPDHLFLSQ